MKARVNFLLLTVILSGTLWLLKDSYQSVNGQSGSSLWSKQFGTMADDFAGNVALDSHGNIIVDGGTKGSLFATNTGGQNIFLAKYDTNGNLIWSKQFGSSKEDGAAEVIIDSNDNIYMVGTTEGALFGPFVGASSNAFIVKFDAAGNNLWAKQFGANDTGAGRIAVDNQNNVCVYGHTNGNLFGTNAGDIDSASAAYDCFLVKYDANGNQLWANQFGAPGNDLDSGLALDGQGNIVVSGDTDELFGSYNGDDEAFVAKFTSAGTLIWGKKFGGPNKEFATAIRATSDGTIYVTGCVSTDPSDLMSVLDGFLSKFDSSGNLLWTTAIATDAVDFPGELQFDLQGNILVSGYTKGSLFAPNAGGEDGFLAAYSPSGSLIWGNQYGTSADDQCNGFAIDNLGYIYLAGDTYGNLFGTNAGGDDAFIQKLSPTGQMALARPRHPSPYKPLLFAWAGQNITLSYPPMLISKKPYIYIGYLCSGIPGAKVRHTATKQIVIENHESQVVISPGSMTYWISGKPHTMAAKPVLVNGHCYVPLDVMKAVLPYPVHYEAKAQTVHFDPPQPKQASK